MLLILLKEKSIKKKSMNSRDIFILMKVVFIPTGQERQPPYTVSPYVPAPHGVQVCCEYKLVQLKPSVLSALTTFSLSTSMAGKEVELMHTLFEKSAL